MDRSDTSLNERLKAHLGEGYTPNWGRLKLWRKRANAAFVAEAVPFRYAFKGRETASGK
jgi:hypothetical protein